MEARPRGNLCKVKRRKGEHLQYALSDYEKLEQAFVQESCFSKKAMGDPSQGSRQSCVPRECVRVFT